MSALSLLDNILKSGAALTRAQIRQLDELPGFADAFRAGNLDEWADAAGDISKMHPNAQAVFNQLDDASKFIADADNLAMPSAQYMDVITRIMGNTATDHPQLYAHVLNKAGTVRAAADHAAEARRLDDIVTGRIRRDVRYDSRTWRSITMRERGVRLATTPLRHPVQTTFAGAASVLGYKAYNALQKPFEAAGNAIDNAIDAAVDPDNPLNPALKSSKTPIAIGATALLASAILPGKAKMLSLGIAAISFVIVALKVKNAFDAAATNTTAPALTADPQGNLGRDTFTPAITAERPTTSVGQYNMPSIGGSRPSLPPIQPAAATGALVMENE